MTNAQLYLAIGVPIVVNIAFNGLIAILLSNNFNARLTSLEANMRDLWRAELRRVEEVLDARLRHIEEQQQR